MRSGYDEAVMCFVLSVFIAVTCFCVVKLSRELDVVQARLGKLEARK
jgi:hypothetical protein